MSTGIIVMGHGHFASGITSSLELIMGSQPDYEALDFPAESDKEDLKKRLNTVLERLERNEQIIISIRLSDKERRETLGFLDNMGYNKQRLFPDLQNLCDSILAQTLQKQAGMS